MRQCKLDISSFATAPIDIGRRGENMFCCIRVDCTDWLIDYPDGIISAVFRRPDREEYPLVVTMDGKVACLDITATETAAAGLGKLELRISTRDVLGKSSVAVTRTLPSLVPGDVPDAPTPDWVEQILAELKDAEKFHTVPLIELNGDDCNEL